MKIMKTTLKMLLAYKRLVYRGYAANPRVIVPTMNGMVMFP